VVTRWISANCISDGGEKGRGRDYLAGAELGNA